jgi:hypothetical protein
MTNSLMVDGRPPPSDFLVPNGIEARLVCLPRGTGGSRCSATRTDLFLIGSPVHGIPRIGYNSNASTNPGAWTLVTMPLSAEDASRISLPSLPDGTQSPLPTECVVNRTRPPDDATARLYLPVPPYYPDEVKARQWARGTGYRMAPPTVCPSTTLRASASNSAGNSSDGSSAGGASSAPASSHYRITSPAGGQRVNGLVSVVGTAQFDPSQVQYYKLEIGSGRSPTEWTTFGTTHSQPVSNGVLEQLHADALPTGDYIIRLVLVGHDGNFIGSPHAVLITVGP